MNGTDVRVAIERRAWGVGYLRNDNVYLLTALVSTYGRLPNLYLEIELSFAQVLFLMIDMLRKSKMAEF